MKSKLIVAVAAVALSFGATAQASNAAGCTPGYAYAGLVGAKKAHGIKGLISALGSQNVQNGHVAGWIGVGGVNAGPGGQAEWLQTGLNQLADGSAELYAELTLPGSGTHYKTLASTVQPGRAYRLAVLQLPGRANTWQVWLDGRPVTKAVVLPGSSSFQPMAIGETWGGGVPSCNGFGYRFDNLMVASQPGSWQQLRRASTLADPGYRVVRRSAASFVATGR